MCIVAGIPALVQVAVAASTAATAVSAYSAYSQGQAASKVAANNAVMAGREAADARQQGELAAQAARRRDSQVAGATRARMAAAGVDLGAGTALDLQAQNDFFAEQDVANARDNAARRAWGFEAQRGNFAFESDSAATQGTVGAFGSVLNGASQVAGKWYSYNNPPPPGGSAPGPG